SRRAPRVGGARHEARAGQQRPWRTRLDGHLHTHCPAWPRANIQAATFAEATASNTLAPPKPARTLLAAQVLGRNWKRPAAPDALYAPGLYRLSQYATRRSCSAS